MANTINSDGLQIRFGNDQGKRGSKGAVTTDTTKHNEYVFTIDLTTTNQFTTDVSNSGANNGFGGLDTVLPAGALIRSQTAIVLVTPVGGTSYSVGTYTQATNTSTPTLVSANNIRTTAGADGTLIGTQITVDNYVAAAVTGTYTAGKVKVVITYVIA